MTHASTNTVLLVCTANVCRSPAAQHLLSTYLSALGLSSVTASSAGVRALEGHPIDARMAELLASDGIQSQAFRARRLDRASVDAATIVLTATTQHRSDVLRVAPRALHKTYTMLEFCQMANNIPMATAPSMKDRASPLEQWLSNARSLSVRPINEATLSIEDPYRRSKKAYKVAYDQIRNAMHSIASSLANSQL